MKIAVLLVDGAKQIMLTPETKHEKEALKMIAPTDQIEAVTKWGNFTYDNGPKHYGMEVAECKAGYYREFPNQESLMFIVTPKKDPANADS